MSPASPNRRQFIRTSTAAAAFVAVAPSINVLGANNRINVAVIGPGGMGSGHVSALAAEKDLRVACVCDPDSLRRDKAAARVESLKGGSPKKVGDFRRILEDKDIDAVFIATPDHWHAPATILACDAGKHVYVEKPASHNLREGRLMIEAARRNKRVVQVGTQSRSATHTKEAIKHIQAGAIGEVLVAKAWNSQRRRDIGKHKPSAPPRELDFDMWVGPAAWQPYQQNLLHATWRWWHNFGTGDMGNDGVHDIDIARWGLGVETHPTRIVALGGKYFFDDDQQFPDTQTVAFEYAGASKSGRPKQLIFEQRIWSPYNQEGFDNGNAWYGTEGMILFSKRGEGKVYGPKNKLIAEFTGKIDLRAHHRNFFDCIRDGGRPAADIEIGHLSSSLCHLGNIATRTGRTLNFDPKTETIAGDKEASSLLSRDYREGGHWAKPKGV